MLHDKRKSSLKDKQLKSFEEAEKRRKASKTVKKLKKEAGRILKSKKSK